MISHSLQFRLFFFFMRYFISGVRRDPALTVFGKLFECEIVDVDVSSAHIQFLMIFPGFPFFTMLRTSLKS